MSVSERKVFGTTSLRENDALKGWAGATILSWLFCASEEGKTKNRIKSGRSLCSNEPSTISAAPENRIKPSD